MEFWNDMSGYIVSFMNEKVQRRSSNDPSSNSFLLEDYIGNTTILPKYGNVKPCFLGMHYSIFTHIVKNRFFST